MSSDKGKNKKSQLIEAVKYSLGFALAVLTVYYAREQTILTAEVKDLHEEKERMQLTLDSLKAANTQHKKTIINLHNKYLPSPPYLKNSTGSK